MAAAGTRHGVSAGEIAAFASFAREKGSLVVNSPSLESVSGAKECLEEEWKLEDPDLLGQGVARGVVIPLAMYGALFGSSEEPEEVTEGEEMVKKSFLGLSGGKVVHKMPKNAFERLENHDTTLALARGLWLLLRFPASCPHFQC
jgi:hypothetical protein